MPLLLQTCVFHGTTFLLLFVGCAAMMGDAFATREREVAEMIRELIDPSYYNSGANSLKEYFLANMYRIVSRSTLKKSTCVQLSIPKYLKGGLKVVMKLLSAQLLRRNGLERLH